MSTICLLIIAVVPGEAGVDPAKLPANQWVLIHEEDSAGGKNFARAIFAQDVQRLCWDSKRNMTRSMTSASP